MELFKLLLSHFIMLYHALSICFLFGVYFVSYISPLSEFVTTRGPRCRGKFRKYSEGPRSRSASLPWWLEHGLVW